jgi:endonuclease YncB( thermonuclease family)
MIRAVSLGLAGFVCAGWTEPSRTLQASPQVCHVARVVDGDTLECSGGVRVRVRGVDTPERGEPGFREAAAELRRRVLGETVVIIPHHHNRGRLVADVMHRGRNVGAEMDASGWSKASGARR